MEKRKRISNIIQYVFSSLFILSLGFLIYSILLYKGIEDLIRYCIVALFILIGNIIVGSIFISLHKDRFKTFVTLNVLVVIFSIINFIGGYVLCSYYKTLNDFNKVEVFNQTALISLNVDYNIEKIKDKKIGIVKDNEDIEFNILPNIVIDKFNLNSNNKIIEFDNSIELMKALYNKEVDLIFVSGNYIELYKTLEGFEKINDETKVIYEFKKEYKKKELEEDITSKVNALEPVTVLLLGVDSCTDGLSSSQSFNGDTIMLITFDPRTLNATMFSIPRDTYVPMACGGGEQKITHSAWGGTNCVVKTVQNLTGIKIDYYVKINFKGVVDLVDAVGGITVDVPEPDIPEYYCLDNSSRVGTSLCLTPGVQKLDGEHALALARVRKAFNLGDFQRGQNQQLIVEALLNELKTIRNVKMFNSILDTVKKNIDTNMTTEEMLSYYNVGKKILFNSDKNIINIQKTWLRGYSLYVYNPGSDMYQYTFQYYKRSLNDIVNAMKLNLGKNDFKPTYNTEFSINKPYEKSIIGNSGYGEIKRELVPVLTGKDVSYAEDFCKRNNIKLSINYVDKDGVINSVISQSIHDGIIADKVSELKVDVIKKSESQIDKPNSEDTNENLDNETTEDTNKEDNVTEEEDSSSTEVNKENEDNNVN